MTKKQVFNKDNLSALLRLQADALDRGEVLEFEEGELNKIGQLNKGPNSWTFQIELNGMLKWTESITLKPKTKLRKATAMEWLEWACSDECKGWAVNTDENEDPRAPQIMYYINMGEDVDMIKRAKFENGKLGELDYFWKEV